jgi:drug/metabolite transporter (DMT)-like permease
MSIIEDGLGKWKTLPGNFRGAIWALVAALMFSGMQVSIKQAGQNLPVWEILVLRSLIALCFILPAIQRQGFHTLRTSRPKTHLLRALLGFGGISTLILALKHLELGVVATLGFTNTLFVVLFAAIFLGEKIVRDRTIATAAGFIGVVICMRPGPEGFNEWTLVMLLSALFAAGVSTSVKSLTRTERPTSILFYSYVTIMLLALGPALYTWQPLTWVDAAVVGLMACFATAGQTCMVMSLRAGEAVAVAPFGYTRILYAMLLGFFIFGELPAWTTLLGAAVIVASTLYIAIRERRGGLQPAKARM